MVEYRDIIGYLCGTCGGHEDRHEYVVKHIIYGVAIGLVR